MRFCAVFDSAANPTRSDMYRNKSCFMIIGAASGVTFEKLSWTDHPYCLPDFKNGVEFSLPFLITHLGGLIVGLLKAARGDVSADETTKKKIDAQITKIEKWQALSRKAWRCASVLPARRCADVCARVCDRCATSARPCSRRCAGWPRAAAARSCSSAVSKASGCLCFMRVDLVWR